MQTGQSGRRCLVDEDHGCGWFALGEFDQGAQNGFSTMCVRCLIEELLDRIDQALGELTIGGEKAVLLVCEVLVKRRSRDSGGGGDLRDRRRLVAALADLVDDGLEEPFSTWWAMDRHAAT